MNSAKFAKYDNNMLKPITFLYIYIPVMNKSVDNCQIFFRKISLFRNHKNLQFRAYSLMVNDSQVHRNKEKEYSLLGLGKAVVNKAIGENVQSIVTFYRLNYGCLPLAELLLGKEESFHPPSEVEN